MTWSDLCLGILRERGTASTSEIVDVLIPMYPNYSRESLRQKVNKSLSVLCKYGLVRLTYKGVRGYNSQSSVWVAVQ